MPKRDRTSTSISTGVRASFGEKVDAQSLVRSTVVATLAGDHSKPGAKLII